MRECGESYNYNFIPRVGWHRTPNGVLRYGISFIYVQKNRENSLHTYFIQMKYERGFNFSNYWKESCHALFVKNIIRLGSRNIPYTVF